MLQAVEALWFKNIYQYMLIIVYVNYLAPAHESSLSQGRSTSDEAALAWKCSLGKLQVLKKAVGPPKTLGLSD